MTKKFRKQIKLLYTAPSHIRHRKLSATLSSTLRERYHAKSLPIRKGDTVKLMRGEHEEREGKIVRVNQKSYMVFIEGVTKDKEDGTPRLLPIHPSNVMITKINLNDKWRKEILERKVASKPTKK